MKPKNSITKTQLVALHYALQSEAQFQAQVIKEAKRLGWEIYHTHNSQHSQPGWPDLVLGKQGIILFRELKKETGRLSVHQRKWLALLTSAGFDADVWYPHDWPAIVELLTLDVRTVTIADRTPITALARIQAQGVR